MTRGTAGPRCGNPAGGERGFILPLVLLGLVAVTIMLMASLLTSSAEVAISGAQQDATVSLYEQESALQQFVAANAAVPLQPTAAAVHPLSATTSIRVARLANTVTPATALEPETGVSVFAITAEPVAGTTGAGRSVVALVRQTAAGPQPLQPNVKAALTTAGDFEVRSNAFSVDGRAAVDCASGTGVQAVRKSAGAAFSGSGASGDGFIGVAANGSPTQGTGAIESTALDRAALTREALGLGPHAWLDDLIAQIPPEHRYGPRFREPDGPIRQFSGATANGETVAVIDAGGGTVELQSGSSLLIVVNGDLHMRGNSHFDGLLLLEGGFSLQGSATVDGALISLGMTSAEGVIGDGETGGGVTIRYDPCAIDRARQGYNENLGTRTVVTTGETFAWFEAVR
jgi:Tfp pilus assembly protein PilX